MKNNSIKKILILVCTVAIAVGAILYFVKTIVTPPVATEVVNLHNQSIDKDINKLTDSKPMAFNDSLYVLIADKIDVFSDEAFLNTEEKDNQIKAFVLKYVPVFKSLCEKRFNSPGWDDTNFPAWRKRIAELLDMKLSDGQSVVQGINKNDLGSITSVMDDYKSAKAVASAKTFSTVSKAKSDIQSAANYSSRPYIGHSKIASELSKVKENIGASHYRNISAKVEELNNFRSLTKDAFDRKITEASSALAEYENNKSIYGSAAKDIASLKNKAAGYIRDANAYYEEQSKPSIQVNLNGSWISAVSPYSSYKAYKSASNWNQSNTKSSMSFDIKGYTSFTFYIDSYAEGSYDYVMVGALNTVPTETSNYANTKDWQKPSTSFSNYKSVSFSGLDKGTSYRIYVVYRKDGSNNNNDDRGYILLPNIAQ